MAEFLTPEDVLGFGFGGRLSFAWLLLHIEGFCKPVVTQPEVDDFYSKIKVLTAIYRWLSLR